METSSNTLARSEEVKSGQGIHELDFSSEGEQGLGENFNTCQKNHGHKKFTPVNEVTKYKLPLRHRTDQKLELIKRLARGTVKLSVNYVSPHRPSQLPLSMLAGERIMSVGSGFVTNVENDLLLCPIKNCTELPGQHSVFGYITITTAAHVVCDDAEAESTTVEFFYDNPEDKSGVMTCRGVKVRTVNINGDFCELLCVTHIKWQFYRIKKLFSIEAPQNRVQEKVCGLFDRFSSLKCISISDSEYISIHIDMDGLSNWEDLLCNLITFDMSKVFADMRGLLDERRLPDIFDEPGTFLRVDRSNLGTIKVSSPSLDFKLDIMGTHFLFNYTLFMNILRCIRGDNFWNKLEFRKLFPWYRDMDSLLQNFCLVDFLDHKGRSKSDTKQYRDIIQEIRRASHGYSFVQHLMIAVSGDESCCETVTSNHHEITKELRVLEEDIIKMNTIMKKHKSNLLGCSFYGVIAITTKAIADFTSQIELLLRRADLRCIKFKEYLGISLDYAQPSIDMVTFNRNTLILNYRCAKKSFTDFDTQSNIPADKNDDWDNPNPWVVHISHPHGQSKMVTFGSLTDCNTGSGYYCPLYTAPTCPGSSGGPTFVLPKTDDLNEIYGMPHRSHHGNMLNEGCAWTMYPTLKDNTETAKSSDKWLCLYDTFQ